MSNDSKPLANRVIAVPETRMLDVLTDMLEIRGAQVLRCPLIAIRDAPDSAPIERFIDNFISNAYDDLIILTGEGLRRLLGFAERSGKRDALIETMSRVRLITRGPKPGRALKEIGLKSNLLADAPTTDGIITTYGKEDITGRLIAVQLYGEEPNKKLIDYLRERGAEVGVVAPYIYASKAESEQVLSLIHKLSNGEVDVIAFTSQPQYKRLESVALKNDLTGTLQKGLQATKVAAIGPTMRALLEESGVRVDIEPDSSFFMKPLVRKMIKVLNSE